MTDLYLRDLNQTLQDDYKRQWKGEKAYWVLKAIREGKDIKIGNYVSYPVVIQ